MQCRRQRWPLTPTRWLGLVILPLSGVTLLILNRNLLAAPVVLQASQPIESADSLLRSQGWQPDGDPDIDTFERELSGNSLSSLRSCSGTGAGFCRYDYRRGREQLQIITIPSRDGDGLVQHWQQEEQPSPRSDVAP